MSLVIVSYGNISIKTRWREYVFAHLQPISDDIRLLDYTFALLRHYFPTTGRLHWGYLYNVRAVLATGHLMSWWWWYRQLRWIYITLFSFAPRVRCTQAMKQAQQISREIKVWLFVTSHNSSPVFFRLKAKRLQQNEKRQRSPVPGVDIYDDDGATGELLPSEQISGDW